MYILGILDLANILLPSYAKTSAFSLVKSRLALGSPGCLVGCHHSKNGLMHGKMVAECPKVITSTFDTLFQTSPGMRKN